MIHFTCCHGVWNNRNNGVMLQDQMGLIILLFDQDHWPNFRSNFSYLLPCLNFLLFIWYQNDGFFLKKKRVGNIRRNTFLKLQFWLSLLKYVSTLPLSADFLLKLIEYKLQFMLSTGLMSWIAHSPAGTPLVYNNHVLKMWCFMKAIFSRKMTSACTQS